MPEELVRVGRIVGPHGLRGEVKVEPLTEFEERFAKGARLRLKGDWVTVEVSREHKGRPLLKLSGIDSATAAEEFKWEYLEAPALEHQELEEGEFFADDLIGLKVFTSKGEEIGEVDDLLRYPAQDILQVGEMLIPMVGEFVKEVDIEGGRIVVELLYGMRPGEAAVEG